MGFSGQLSSVNIADIFQTLHMNRQTGTLSVIPAAPAPGAIAAREVHIYFEGGQVAACTAPPVENRPFVINAMARKGMLQPDQVEELVRRLKQTGQNVRDLVLATGWMAEVGFNEISAWSLEEQVCPVFEWPEGEFLFTDGDPVPQLQAQDIVEVPRPFHPTTALVMEATRRKDEWKRIHEVLPDESVLLIIDNDGRANLRSIQTDPEMQKVMRLMDGRRSVDAIAAQAGTTRFDTFAICAQLVVAQVARPRSAAEIVDDAIQLKAAGDRAKAQELLENALRQGQAPEILRPLAEVNAELGQVPRAVELYLTLIQQAQDQGDLESALRDLDTVLALSPDDPDLRFDRAQLHAELGHVEPAANGYVEAAQAYLATKDIAKAVDSCHRAKNLLPRSPDPHRWLAKAYLLDGNTENAVVEYKALWHALLSGVRPKAALEELGTILASDCKYQSVKDQVLAHAQNSEAVKNSKALRAVLKLVMVLLVIAGAWLAWRAYEDTIQRRSGNEAVAELSGNLSNRYGKVEHIAIQREITDLRKRYGAKFPEMDAQLAELAKRTEADYNTKADEAAKQADALFENGRYAEAYAALDALAKGFPESRALGNVLAKRTTWHAKEISIVVDARLAEARRQWDALNWDEALAMVKPILARTDLPNDRRTEITNLQVEWEGQLSAAAPLARRAERIEARRDFPAALIAWRRAVSGTGEADAARAKDRLAALERVVADDLLAKARDAAGKGDDAGAFARVDEALALAKEAVGPGPKQALAAVQLPFAVQVDSRAAGLAITRASGATEQVRAPAGPAGAWRHVFEWRLDETIQIACVRPGFTPQTTTVSLANRRSRMAFTLVRGPRVRVELSGMPCAAPVASGGSVLVPTTRGVLDVVDPVVGAARGIPFPDAVTEFAGTPILLGGRAYAVLDHRLQAVDLSARNRLWAWPDEGANQRISGNLLVQEHDLIQNRLLIVAGSDRGLIVADADPTGRVTTYPALARPIEATGTPVGEHLDATTSLVFVPAGPNVVVLDVAAASRAAAPEIIATVKLRGDAIGRPVPATVAGQRALLVQDASGLVTAIAIDPKGNEAKRLIGSWPVDGTSPSQPTVAGDVAYVSVPEGRVHALDLTSPGTLAWRAPARPTAGQGAGGTLGTLIGSPVAGKSGIYIADANGILRCLDAATGAELWKADLGAPAVGGIVIADGRLVIPTRAGQAVVFEEGE